MDSPRVIFLFLTALFSTLVHAGTATDLYSSEQLVPQQYGEPTTQQVRDGLSDVLVKVTGSRDVLSRPAVLERTGEAKRMLQQFGYRAAQQAITTDSGRAEAAYVLKLDFDPQAVDKLLGAAGERPLGATRPSLVVWLAAQEQGERDYVAPDGYIYQQAISAAAKRGLPLRVPLYDLTDQRALPLSDLWGLFERSIRDASARYNAEAVLAGQLIQRSNGRWHLEWLLLNGEQQQRFSSDGVLESELPAMIEQTTDRLFAALQGNGFTYRLEGLAVQVSNVDSLADYVDIIDYLQSIPAVTSVHVARVEESVLTLTVELNGNLEQLEQSLNLQPGLVQEPVARQDFQGLTLHYRWQR